jgi:hypothetical protein
MAVALIESDLNIIYQVAISVITPKVLDFIATAQSQLELEMDDPGERSE